MSSKKIFFTGGGGFIGREVIPFLENDGYEVFAPSSKDLNLLDSDAVDNYVRNYHFDIIIHSAICGGRRCKEDGLDVFYNNMRMFENVFRYVKTVKKFINFDSGASLFNLGKVADTPYGFSKYSIARSVNGESNGTNLRIYGCFGTSDHENRFFNTNVKNYYNKNPIVIFKDKLMDFMYIEDIYKILKLSLETEIKDFDCVYEKKYYLSDLAKMINNLSNHNVKIVIESSKKDTPYCGNFCDLSIDFIGIEEGLKSCYGNFFGV